VGLKALKEPLIEFSAPTRRADLLSAARGAHDAGESRVAIRGAGSAARGDHHALAIAEKQ
jgi:hypothetical protein